MSRHERRAMIDRGHHELSVVRQCELLDISRSSAYYNPVQADEYELELMGLVDKQYLLTPFYGSRKMAVWLRGQGHQVNRKRVQRLMRRMGIEAIYRRPRTTMPDSGHKVYPYLLRGLEIDRVNQVWAADITYIPMVHGFMYLVCVMDWHSRYVLSWRLSNTLEADSCVDALEEALSRDLPGVFNTDQGSQFTSEAFTSVLVAHGVRISMDSVGSYMDNVFVERLWRSVKYEEVYLKAYESVAEARAGIGAYLRFYNSERPHQTLDYRTPAQVFEEGRNQVHQSEVSLTPETGARLTPWIGVLDSRNTLNKGSEGFSGGYWGSFAEILRPPGLFSQMCRPLISLRRGRWQPLTGPSGGPRPDLAHCAHVSQSVGPPPSAGCPSQKAAPDAPCSSPVPGSAPCRSQTPASLSGKGAPPWP